MSHKRKFFIIKVLENSEHAWFSSTYVLYLLASGLTLSQTAIVNTAFMCINFIIDPFTGWVGDKFGHIRVYLAGVFVMAIGMTLYGFPQGFLWFIMCESIAAIGSALMSQALESWLVNSFGNEEASRVKAWSKGRLALLTILPRTLGSLIGSAFGLNVPFLLAGLTCFVSFAVGLYLFSNEKEVLPLIQESVDKKQPLRRTLRVEIASVWQVAMLWFLIAVSFQALNMYWTAHFEAKSGAIWWLGIYSTLIGLTTGWGPSLAMRYFHPDLRHIGLTTAAMAVFVLICAITDSFFVLFVIFLAHEVCRGVISQLVDTYLNERFSNAYRSTLNSILSSVYKAGAAIGLFMLSTLTFIQPEHIPYLWVASSIVMFIAAGICIIPTRSQQN